MYVVVCLKYMYVCMYVRMYVYIYPPKELGCRKLKFLYALHFYVSRSLHAGYLHVPSIYGTSM